jgi:pimeloyl-ACP methyl ester carboxylesterase
MNFVEPVVHRGQHRIYVKEYPGEEPSIVLMHGFPDNLHLHDRLVAATIAVLTGRKDDRVAERGRQL